MGYLESRNNSNPQLLCYYMVNPLKASAKGELLNGRVRTNPAGTPVDYITPAVHCFEIAKKANDKLLDIVGTEINTLQGN